LGDVVSIMAAVQYTTIGTQNAHHNPSNFGGAYQMKSVTPALGIGIKF
jgi:hypothetical protein